MHDNNRERPFPWKCPECLKPEVVRAKIPYAADVKHDGLLHSLHLDSFEVPKCRSCGELLFDDHADEQISSALRSHLHLLSPQEIRHERKTLALSQCELADQLGVAEATISRWETGALIQSRAIDNLLRLYFAIPETRTALKGKWQHVEHRVSRKRSQNIAKPPAAPNDQNSRFPFAARTYGVPFLVAEAKAVQDRGVFLPIC